MSDDTEKPLPPRIEHGRRLAPGVMLTWSNRPDPDRESGAWERRNAALIQYRAESLADMIAHVTSPEGQPKRPFGAESRDNEAKPSWDLGVGWKGALALSSQGWRDGRRAIAEAMATLPGDLVISPPQLADVAGGVLDCAAHVAGAPDCFDVDDDDAPGRARVIRLLVHTAASCGVPAQHFMNRGAAIASVIDALEAGGISCEIEALCTGEGNNYDQVTIRHIVKRAGDPLNLEAVAISLAHPGIFRRIDFAALESIGDFDPGFTGGAKGWKPASIAHGYGTPETYRCHDAEIPGTVIIPRLQASGQDHSSPAKARESIAEAMRALGFNVSFEPATAHATR